MVALGVEVAGLMGNNQKWCDQVLTAAQRAGEKAWQLPMFPLYNELIKSDPAQAQNLVGQGINNATGKPLAADVIAASFKNLTFTNDPIATSLRKSAKDAEAAGLLKAVDLKGIYNLKLLNQVLTKQGEPTVKS